MKQLRWIGAIGLALGAVSALIGVAQARDFAIASWGGGLQDAQRQAYFKPFAEAAKINFTEDVYLGGWAKFQTMVDSKQVVWDFVNVARLRGGGLPAS